MSTESHTAEEPLLMGSVPARGVSVCLVFSLQVVKQRHGAGRTAAYSCMPWPSTGSSATAGTLVRSKTVHNFISSSVLTWKFILMKKIFLGRGRFSSPLHIAGSCHSTVSLLPSPPSLLLLQSSPSFSRSSYLALSQPDPSKLLPTMFHAHFVSVSFLTRSDSQPFCASVFYGSSLVTVLLGKRWLQAMTCDFQGRGEQGNFKQHGLLLGAVPFRALVSVMTSPLYLFTLGKPSMLPSGLEAGKFPVPAMAQSFQPRLRNFALPISDSTYSIRT